MPEIPDLNIFCRNLNKRLEGKKLAEITVLIDRQLKVPEAVLKSTLEHQVLISIKRIGKELHFGFGNGHVLVIHLMLHGTMYWYEGENGNRFTIAELLFADGTGLAITDWQKAVMLKLDPEPVPVPDAMDMQPGYLKTVLTEGKMVQGIGNAYVDEILYAAKISPFSAADKIPEDRVEVLFKAISMVLRDAENHISQNFPDTITEKERDFLQVHRPKQKLTLAGEEILKAEIDKRKTYYIAGQELFD
jgi:formamidopyrimidine-DNA glycosylase